MNPSNSNTESISEERTMNKVRPLGRSTHLTPPNRFEKTHIEIDENNRRMQTKFFRDNSQNILTENNSPDIDFRYSLNPYRGCEHGCIYCYARPTHEYLGFSAGLDFETKIVIKHNAAQLLEKTFQKHSWKPQTIALSGNTDCYQPVERKLKLTQECLRIFLGFQNPVSIITKNHLVMRDVDILSKLAAMDLVSVTVSVTTLLPELATAMEPRASGPNKRLETIEYLSRKGIPVGVNVAPIIPGLNEEEIPSILRAASERGAKWASYVLLRLPGSTKPLFLDWLNRSMPNRSSKVVHAIKNLRKGQLSDPQFGSRMEGIGKRAKLLQKYFQIASKACGLSNSYYKLSNHQFIRYQQCQLDLFLTKSNYA